MEIHAEQGFVFCHFDSRGGSTLVLADRLSKAAASYEEMFVPEPAAVAAFDLMEEPAGPVIVISQKRLEGMEALEPWGGDHRAFKGNTPWGPVLIVWPHDQDLDSSPVIRAGLRAMGWMMPDDTSWPETIATDDITDDLGEDAFGLIVQRA